MRARFVYDLRGAGIHLVGTQLTVRAQDTFLGTPSYAAGAVDVTERFFATILLRQAIHVKGIPAWGPWDSTRLSWAPENYLRKAGDPIVRTSAELEAAVKEPVGDAPLARTVWVHESLENDVKALWEAMSSRDPSKPSRG